MGISLTASKRTDTFKRYIDRTRRKRDAPMPRERDLTELQHHVCQFVFFFYIYFVKVIEKHSRRMGRNDIYGSFHGRFTVKIFFSTKHFFLPFYFENNRHIFFFQCDTWKFRDIIFLILALGQNFFFQQLTVKAILNIKCNPCTWNARKSTSFQKSYSTHFVIFFVITI